MHKHTRVATNSSIFRATNFHTIPSCAIHFDKVCLLFHRCESVNAKIMFAFRSSHRMALSPFRCSCSLATTLEISAEVKCSKTFSVRTSIQLKLLIVQTEIYTNVCCVCRVCEWVCFESLKRIVHVAMCERQNNKIFKTIVAVADTVSSSSFQFCKVRENDFVMVAKFYSFVKLY